MASLLVGDDVAAARSLSSGRGGWGSASIDLPKP
ncbi:hypothetical protein CCACVL1_21040 [Corchorus capsularis]|uniref:Uncharacterized protein n=1 Tax=Corchorus capsularis TaxID=210143 RepID=A0A1R3H8M7_COCAP|nr:hypothetical protein CCACVL1_21040 [Corchorus capsularis]